MGRYHWDPALPDLEYWQNNGVVAVGPAPGGRLHLLRLRTRERGEVGKLGQVTEVETVWIFDRRRDGEVRDELKAIAVGTGSDWQAFVRLCKELGLNLTESARYVPFSNGLRKRFTAGDGLVIWRYEVEELMMIRPDQPTRERLALALAECNQDPIRALECPVRLQFVDRSDLYR